MKISVKRKDYSKRVVLFMQKIISIVLHLLKNKMKKQMKVYDRLKMDRYINNRLYFMLTVTKKDWEVFVNPRLPNLFALKHI